MSSSSLKKFVPLERSKEHKSLKKSSSSKERTTSTTPAAPSASIHKVAKKKKEKLLNTLSASSEADKRKAMESGRVKFLGQELRISGMKKLRASKCIVIGDDNTVIGNDNVLVGTGNKAIGEGNRLTTAQREEQPSVSRALSSSIVAAVEAREDDAALAVPAVSARLDIEVVNVDPASIRRNEVADDPVNYSSNQYWSLPENWIIVNGSMIWRPEDIKIVLREHLKFARAHNLPMQDQPRCVNFEESLLRECSAEFLELFGKYDIPRVPNVDQAALAMVSAAATGRIPMPPGLTQCRVKPIVGKLLIPLVDPDAPPPLQQMSATPAASAPARQPKKKKRSAPMVGEDLPPQAQAQPQAPKTVPAESFMPKPGEQVDANSWLVSALDLPGTASKAGKDEAVCRICMDNRCDVLFEPCHHLVACRECTIEIYKEIAAKPGALMPCPTCRKPIKFFSIVFAGS